MLLTIILGLISLFFILLTATLGGLILKNKTKLTVKDHKRLAMISVLFLILHIIVLIVWINK